MARRDQSVEEVLNEYYERCKEDIEFMEERIACLEFSFRDDHVYRQHDQHLNDAYCTMMSHLRRRLNDVYAQFFSIQNLFTAEQKEKISTKVAKRYASAYEDIVKKMGISTIPDPKHFTSDREAFKREIERLKTQEGAQEIVDELAKDLP